MQGMSPKSPFPACGKYSSTIESKSKMSHFPQETISDLGFNMDPIIGAVIFICFLLSLITLYTMRRKKPLLILDMNNVLLFRCHQHFQAKEYPQYVKYNHLANLLGGRFLTWQRPHLIPFIEYCLANYTVAIWSSARPENVNDLVDFVFGKCRSSLLFVWDQTHCKVVEPVSILDGEKPQFRKQISHVWKQFPDFNETNTLMIDDSADKMIENPRQTQWLITRWFPDMMEDTELLKLQQQGFYFR